MSQQHDPNNKDCPRHGQYAAKSECTCLPAADEVEQIRKARQKWLLTGAVQGHINVLLKWVDALLRIVDRLRAENAAKDAEIERLRNHIRELHGIGESEFPPLPEGFHEMKYKPYYYWRQWSRSRLADAGLLSVLEQPHD